MPMTILFLGTVFALLINEAEEQIRKDKNLTFSSFIQLRKVRSSWVMILFFLLTALLATSEIILFSKGEIYTNNFTLIGFARLLILFTAASFGFYVKYHAIFGRPAVKNSFKIFTATVLVLLILLTLI